MAQIIKIKSLEYITPDVVKIVASKPTTLVYNPGQAVDVSINKQGWEQVLRAFTFTSVPDDDFIEFIIKTYPSHHGVTEKLTTLSTDDELIIQSPFGDISYKGEGIFIAGGAGVTPFVSIFKQLEKENKVGNNKLIFANKTKSDIINANRFKMLLGKNFINILSVEKCMDYVQGYITIELLKKHIDNTTKYYYLCGPEPMMQAVQTQLSTLGIHQDYIIREAF